MTRILLNCDLPEFIGYAAACTLQHNPSNNIHWESGFGWEQEGEVMAFLGGFFLV